MAPFMPESSTLAIASLIAGIFSLLCSVLLIRHLYCTDHNWIIEPGCKSKLCSIISSIAFSIGSFMNVTYWILFILIVTETISYTDFIDISQYITAVLLVIGGRFYYYYLLFNIQDEIRQNSIIKHAVPNFWMTIMKIAIIIDLMYVPISYFLSWIFYDNETFLNVEFVLAVSGTLFFDFGFLYIYIHSLHIYAKWWKGKNWNESERYGITQREHEILTRITRFCVVATIAATIDVLVCVIDVCEPYDAGTVLIIIGEILTEISNLSHGSAIYFSYEFGHSSYLKICGKFHRFCYKKSISIHKQRAQLENNYVQLN